MSDAVNQSSPLTCMRMSSVDRAPLQLHGKSYRPWALLRCACSQLSTDMGTATVCSSYVTLPYNPIRSFLGVALPCSSSVPGHSGTRDKVTLTFGFTLVDDLWISKKILSNVEVQPDTSISGSQILLQLAACVWKRNCQPNTQPNAEAVHAPIELRSVYTLSVVHQRRSATYERLEDMKDSAVERSGGEMHAGRALYRQKVWE